MKDDTDWRLLVLLVLNISNWLRNKKIETPRLIKKTKLMDLNRQPKSCYLYPYFEGRYCSESKEDYLKLVMRLEGCIKS